MDNETVVAASSPVEAADPFKGEQVSMSEFHKYRTDGELPERFKPAEDAGSAPAETSKETETEIDGESETPKTEQEKAERKPKPTAEERIAQLESTIEKIRKGAGLEKTQAESSPAKSEPAAQQPPPTRPKPTADDTNQDGTPKFSTYEDFVEDLADWKAEQREVKTKREQQQEAQVKSFNAKVEEARGRYENFDDVMQPAVDAIVNDAKVSPVVKQMLDDSDVLPDLMFTIGSDPAELAKFVKMAKENPGKAIRHIALTESLIAKELEGKSAGEVPPAKPKTQAPKPPSPVGGASSRAFDVSDESLSAEEWARKRTKELQNRKG